MQQESTNSKLPNAEEKAKEIYPELVWEKNSRPDQLDMSYCRTAFEKGYEFASQSLSEAINEKDEEVEKLKDDLKAQVEYTKFLTSDKHKHILEMEDVIMKQLNYTSELQSKLEAKEKELADTQDQLKKAGEMLMSFAKPCLNCEGSGLVHGTTCVGCNGQGKVVTLPPISNTAG